MKITSDVKSSSEKKPTTKTKKKSTNKKKKIDEKFAEDRQLSEKISEKFSKHKRKEEDGAVLKFKVKGDKKKVNVENSMTHNNVILQAEERHVSKQYQLELRNDALSSQFKCAACGQRSCVGELGDLYGPYYVRIENHEHWPQFLVKKPAKVTKKDEFLIDVWLHGDCALNLPKVFLQGGELVHLEEVINRAWKQKCVICHEIGATLIAVSGNAHYPCAKSLVLTGS